jgi:hypothetical protein
MLQTPDGRLNVKQHAVGRRCDSGRGGRTIWLVEYGGGERALSELTRCFPGADVFAPVDFMATERRHSLQGVASIAENRQAP